MAILVLVSWITKSLRLAGLWVAKTTPIFLTLPSLVSLFITVSTTSLLKSSRAPACGK